MMIDRLLYAATALTLASVLMFDDTFSANLIRAIGPIAVPSLNPWEMAVAGILAALIVTVLYPMKTCTGDQSNRSSQRKADARRRGAYFHELRASALLGQGAGQTRTSELTGSGADLILVARR